MAVQTSKGDLACEFSRFENTESHIIKNSPSGSYFRLFVYQCHCCVSCLLSLHSLFPGSFLREKLLCSHSDRAKVILEGEDGAL